ncbi:hypothetical protein ACQP2Y_21205 [Actinoplanes sp. CA-051413]|uniref:hypothetical protein n=1 Tax=Actinoplanes sp. CA-051413 TaxID=3239899 RepID=UPI003D9514CE
MPVGDQHPLELLNDDAWADEPRRLADDVFGHRMRACNCGSDPARERHYECGQCGRTAFTVDGAVKGAAVQVGCQFTEVGRAYNEQNGVQW